MSKIVYQTDHAGYFVGIATADESPLEPGVYLIPAGCTEVAPPQAGPKQMARLIGSEWVVEDVPAPEPTPMPEADGATTDQLWAGLRAERDRRLAISDVRVLPDLWEAYPSDLRAAWAAYRQALRDLPEITTDPAAPDWPVPPQHKD